MLDDKFWFPSTTMDPLTQICGGLVIDTFPLGPTGAVQKPNFVFFHNGWREILISVNNKVLIKSIAQALGQFKWVARALGQFKWVARALGQFKWVARALGQFKWVARALGQFKWVARALGQFKWVARALGQFKWVARALGQFKSCPSARHPRVARALGQFKWVARALGQFKSCPSARAVQELPERSGSSSELPERSGSSSVQVGFKRTTVCTEAGTDVRRKLISKEFIKYTGNRPIIIFSFLVGFAKITLKDLPCANDVKQNCIIS